MELSVKDVVVEAIQKRADKLIGDKDLLLNSVVKLDLLGDHQSRENIEKILAEIRHNNEIEMRMYDEEFTMTCNKDGNIVELSLTTINEGEEGEKNTENIL